MTDFRLLILFTLFFGCASAQFDSTLLVKGKKGTTLKKLGKSALQQNDPATAITLLEAYLQQNAHDAQAMSYLGEAYLKTRDYDRAQRTFLRAYNKNREKAPEALYYHAQMQKSNGQYDSAKFNFQRFRKEYKGEEKQLKKIAAREIVFCDSVHQLLGVEHKMIIQHLDTTINKVHVEAAPANLSDGELVFTSFRTEKREYISEEDTSKGLKRKLYLAKRDTSGWFFAGEFGPGFNDEDYHTGNACFSPDRKRLYFTRCKLNYMEEMTCAIWVSRKEGEVWSEPVKLPKPVNHPKYTSTMPAVTMDPKRGNDIIYFVSNRKGKGGLDIFYTIYDKKKDLYKVPKNAGTKINSAEDEITPFFDSETRTLYFSSKGWGGLGGFDVFRTKGDGRRWTGIENLGQPVNSGADDIFYTISTNREEGFFVSNRKGGNALKNSTCCDDIYYYKHSEYIRIALKGTVEDVMNPGVPVPNATIEIYVRDKNTNERFLVKTVQADSLGNYSTMMEPGQDYFVVVKKDDFLGTSEDVTTKDITISRDINRNLQLTRKPVQPIHIPNIKYLYDKSEIEEGSKIVLDTTVLRLMENNPELVIEIMAHTDSKGSESYNNKLSQKRAESVVKYLLSKGLAADRLKAKGYGETQPVAPNDNPDGSDNPEGRAKNRRTEFRIIGVVDAEIINEADDSWMDND